MKFLYEYRTSDNVRHEGVIAASDREAAFAALKAQGIRPGRVTEAPGFLNKLFGRGKRWAAIVILGFVAAIAVILVFSLGKRLDSTLSDLTAPMHRHQIYGDPALMAELERGEYASAFVTDGDRLLARFAQPGVFVRPPTREERPAMVAALAALSEAGDIMIVDSDPREVRELKRTVLWMRGELKTYLSNGVGTPDTYLTRLYGRQNRECQVYNQARHDLRNEKDPVKFERINQSLRNIGLRTIMPVDSAREGVTQSGEKL